MDGTPRLYQTDPSGIYSEWKANAIGRSSKTVREFLEKNYDSEMEEADAIKLAIKSLLEVVQTGAKNIEVVVMTKTEGIKSLQLDEVEAVCQDIDREKEAEAERKKQRLPASARTQE